MYEFGVYYILKGCYHGIKRHLDKKTQIYIYYHQFLNVSGEEYKEYLTFAKQKELCKN